MMTWKENLSMSLLKKNEYDKQMEEAERVNKFWKYIRECSTRQHDAFMLLKQARQYAEQENLTDLCGIADSYINAAKEYVKKYRELCR